MNFNQEYKQYLDFMREKQNQVFGYDKHDDSLNMSVNDFHRYKNGVVMTDVQHRHFLLSRRKARKEAINKMIK